jgi:hypothetical protein
VTALLLDEMLSPTIAQKLRERGHDVYAISERPDLVGLPDEQVLGLGAVEARAVVTLNIADFAALHADCQARGRVDAGIVFVANAAFPQDRAFTGALVKALDSTIRAEEMPGRDQSMFLRRG